ncbi:MAG: outer membrane lipoprotein carrier protein LolA, partial [Pseudomonadota bacterium]
MRISLLITAFLVSALPLRAEISVQDISSYLNSFRTAAAAFTQVNSDGSISTGDLSLRRPGRARFDYDAPRDHQRLAGGV